MRPKSSSWVLILRSSVARIVLSSIGISYCLPVRLSVTVRVSPDVPASAPALSCLVSVVMALLSRGCRGVLRPAFFASRTTAEDSSTPDRSAVRLSTGRGTGEDAGGDRDHHQHEADTDDAALAARSVGKLRPAEPDG